MDGGDCLGIRHPAFPYPVFGRFTYTVSALYGHCFLFLLSGIGFVQCSSISDTVCVNSRTLDIGKAGSRIPRQPPPGF